MFIDIKESTEIKRINVDLCIIGGGAAGVAIAREFIGTDFSVALLESGKIEPDESIQDLYKGQWLLQGPKSSKRDDNVPRMARLRQFGGSSCHWGGMCAAFDEIDFQSRPWVPDSGWPINRSELTDYYHRAATLLKVPRYDYSEFPDYNSSRPQLPFMKKGGALTTKIFHHSPVNFGKEYGDALKNAKNVTVYFNASVTKLNADRPSGHIRSAQISPNHPERKIEIVAKKFVLACGGLENPRLLLNSNDVFENGIGNQYDLVGRYFMGHSHFISQAGAFFMHIRPEALSLYQFEPDQVKNGHTSGYLNLSAATQEKLGVLNAIFGIGRWSTDIDGKAHPEQSNTIQTISEEVTRIQTDLNPNSSITEPIYKKYYQVFIEHEPLHTSRVQLMDDVDWLGLKKIDVRAQVSQMQLDTLKRTIMEFGKQLGQSGLGRAQLITDDEKIFAGVQQVLGFHHIGTTRMHTSPQKGVVNENCRVYGHENLFVAGSSTFPTSGGVNPTFTITALSLRLADHLKRVLHGT